MESITTVKYQGLKLLQTAKFNLNQFNTASHTTTSSVFVPASLHLCLSLLMFGLCPPPEHHTRNIRHHGNPVSPRLSNRVKIMLLLYQYGYRSPLAGLLWASWCEARISPRRELGPGQWDSIERQPSISEQVMGVTMSAMSINYLFSSTPAHRQHKLPHILDW